MLHFMSYLHDMRLLTTILLILEALLDSVECSSDFEMFSCRIKDIPKRVFLFYKLLLERLFTPNYYIEYMGTDVVMMYENNAKQHLSTYVERFVNGFVQEERAA